ncbi:MAG: integrase family protein [Myxococcaceae bacterium]|nr:integrase family protein [Myxococcaceae bacterium]
MPTAKLTTQLIDGTAPQRKRFFIWDTEVRGLALRVAPTGRKVFQLYYRATNGEQRSPVVGTYGAITLLQARGIAQSMLGEARAGGDPSCERKAARKSPTVSDACTRFLEEHAAKKKPSTNVSYTHLVNTYVKPTIGARKVASITHQDITRIVYPLSKKYPTQANRLRATLSKLFALTEKWGMRPNGSNPVVHVERSREVQRHRDLNEDELERLAKVLLDAEGSDPELALNPRAIAIIRLLMFTGCRRSEVLRLRWSEVDLERSILRLGDSKTGAKIVHLNVAARDVIEAQSKLSGNPYVFPSDWTEGRPLSDIKRIWDLVRQRSGLDGEGAMRLHDLRHHYASTAAAAGLSLPLIGKLLGHTNPATTARYAQLADDPARRGAEEVGRLISSALRPAALPADGAAAN